MRAIEQPQFRLFPGRDGGSDLNPRAEVGSRPAKLILDHPLQKGFGLDHRLVLDAQQSAERRHILRCRRRHDPVNHRLREGAPRRDPFGQRRIMPLRQRQHRAPQPPAVMRQIVATDRREGRQPGGPPPRQRRHQIARRGLRLVQRCQIGGQLRIAFVERASRRVELISLLGHGQGDDMRFRRRQRRQQRIGLFRRDDHLLHRADHLRAIGHAIAHQHRVEPILRRHLVAHAGRSQRRGDDAPAQVARIQRLLEHHRLMRPVEGADAQMHDAAAHRPAVIARPRDIGRQRRQRCGRQAAHSL